MFDQLLAKENFFEYLKGAGVADEKAQELWDNVEKSFSVLLLANAFASLPESDRVLLSFSFDDSKPEEVQSFIDGLNNFLRENPDKIDKKKLLRQTAEQVYKSLAKSIEGENGAIS